MRFVILIFISLLCLLELKGQAVTFTFGSGSGQSGDIIEIQFSVTGFNDIVSFQFPISWDPTVVQFVSLQQSSALIPIISYNDLLPPTGWINLSYGDPDIVTTLLDGTVIFSLFFELIGENCETSLLYLFDPTGDFPNDVYYQVNGVDVLIPPANVTFENGEVIIHPLVEINESICEGEVYVFGSQVLTISDTYYDTISIASGCDSIVILNLEVFPNYDIEIDAAICANQTYSFFGQNLSTEGIYTETVNIAGNCDSTVTLNLTINPVHEVVLNESICEGETFEFFGIPFNTTTSNFPITLSNQFGCDSVVILNLTVLENETSTLYESICEGEVFEFDGMEYSTAGQYPVNFTNANGCDSTVILNLTVNPNEFSMQNIQLCSGDTTYIEGHPITYIPGVPFQEILATTAAGCQHQILVNVTNLPSYQNVLNESICAGENYTFGNLTLTSSGTYTQEFTTANGCDSIVTLNLQVNQPFVSSVSHQMCQGEVFTFQGMQYSTTGVYPVTYMGPNGCDSTFILNLTVNPAGYTQLFDTICQGQSVNFFNQIVSETGVYSYALFSGSLCDSIVELNLTVLPNQETFLEETICFGTSFNYNGQVYSQSGVYPQIYTASNGCDSIVYLELTVLPQLFSNVNAEICPGGTYNFFGNIIDQPGNYQYPATSTTGCDSTVFLNLVLTDVIISNVTETICDNETYFFDGEFLNQPGPYSATLVTPEGCDSIVNLNLIVLPTHSSSFSQSICQGASFSFAGNSYSAPGVYTAVLESVLGCDSTVTLTLSVNPLIENSITESICAGSSLDFHGQTLDESGIYTAMLQTPDGCDSLLTLNLTVSDLIQSSTDTSICAGSSYNFHGQTLDSAGIYTAMLQTPDGCDSLVTLDLVIADLIESSISESICEGSIFNFVGQILDSAGVYTAMLQTPEGCDSLVTLNLVVEDLIENLISESICEGTTFDFVGQILDSAGIYTAMLQTPEGCDSLVILDLQIIPILDTALFEAIYIGQTYNFHGTELSQTGIYPDTLTSTGGCDSIVVLNLTVMDIPDPVDSSAAVVLCPGQTFMGQSFTADTSITITLPGEAIGIPDTILTVSITLSDFVQAFSSLTFCELDEFMGVTLTIFNNGQFFYDTIPAATGCDTVFTYQVFVQPQSNFNETIFLNVCPGDTVNGQPFFTDGSTVQVIETDLVCDSVITYVVFVIQPTTTIVPMPVCPGDTVNGQPVFAPFSFTDTLQSTVTGCDSFVVTQVSILPIPQMEEFYTLCPGDSLYGVAFFAADTFNLNFTGPNGCDSLITVFVEIAPAPFTLDQQFICSGSEYLGTLITGDTIWFDTLLTTFNCDSVVERNITALEVPVVINPVTICEGESVFGIPLFADTVFTELWTAANGCDSFYITEVTVLPHAPLTVVDTFLCSGNLFQGIAYSAPDMVIDTLLAANGCDSVVQYNIGILPVYSDTFTLTACFGDEVLGVTVTGDTAITIQYLSADFCDSTVTTLVTVLPVFAETSFFSFCGQGEVLGQTFTADTTFTITYTAQNGCDSLHTYEVEVLEIPSTVFSITVCFGDSVLGQPVFSDVVLNATFTAANGCDSLVQAIVTVNPLPQPSISGNPVFCPGESTILTASGGFVSYLWGDSSTALTLEVFNVGTYSLTVTDINGCSNTTDFSVTTYDPISIDVNLLVQPTNPSASNGQIGVAVSGGSGSFSYTWSNGAQVPLITNLPGGTYCLSLTDSNGCQADTCIVLEPHPPFEASVTFDTLPCANFSTGVVSATPTGGLEPYTIQLSGNGLNETQNSNTAGVPVFFSGLPQGIYTLTLTDALGQVVVLQSIVVTPPPISLPQQNIQIQHVACFGGDNGSITVTPIGGTPPYTFTWNTPNFSENGQSSTAFNLPAGQYSVIVEDANGCSSGQQQIAINQPNTPLSLSTSTTDALCAGESSGQATVEASGGSPGYFYNWQNGQNMPTATGLSVGQYTVTVTDSHGCTAVDSATVSEPQAIDFVLIDSPSVCYNTPGGQIAVAGISGGLEPYVFRLNNEGPYRTDSVFTNLFTGTYVVTVMDANGCRSEAEIFVASPPEPLLVITGNSPINLGDSTLLAAYSNFDFIASWSWSPPFALNILDSLRAWASPQETTTYTLSLVDSNGCAVSATYLVEVREPMDVFIPNVFSPNGDDQNDVFFVHAGRDVARIESMVVYDRWGSLVFSAGNVPPNDRQYGWNGTSSGQSLESGVYVYRIRVEFINGRVKEFTGGVTLVR